MDIALHNCKSELKTSALLWKYHSLLSLTTQPNAENVLLNYLSVNLYYFYQQGSGGSVELTWYFQIWQAHYFLCSLVILLLNENLKLEKEVAFLKKKESNMWTLICWVYFMKMQVIQWTQVASAKAKCMRPLLVAIEHFYITFCPFVEFLWHNRSKSTNNFFQTCP